MPKNYKFYIIFIICLSIFVFCLLANLDNNKIVKCNMKFGLCPAAKCVPNPYDSSKAYCFCDVATGTNYSVGNSSCENIRPYTNDSGEEIIFSDFSPVINKMGYHLESCPAEAVNLNCMNKICSVYPNDPTKALCICDKLDNKGLSWSTFNKNGEPKICNYKSGASTQDNVKLNAFIKNNP